MKKLYFIGHKNPDLDAFVAPILAKYCFSQSGVFADYELIVVNHNVNYPPHFDKVFEGIVKEDFSKAVDRLELNDEDKVFLVDHNEQKQWLDGIVADKIIGIIDHHNFNITVPSPLFVVARPWGSSATIITNIIINKNFDLPDNLARIALSAIIDDTVILKSPITTRKDIEVVNILSKKLGIDDITKFGIELFNAKSDISNTTADKLYNQDSKEYDMGGKKVHITQIETVDSDGLSSYIPSFHNIMKKNEGKYDVDLVLFTDIIKEGGNFIYIDKSIDVLNKAFGKDFTGKGELFIKSIMSRKKDVVPKLMSVLNNA